MAGSDEMADIVTLGTHILEVLRIINEAVGAWNTVTGFVRDDLATVLNKISEIEYESAIDILEEDLPKAGDKHFQLEMAVDRLSKVYKHNLKKSQKYESSFWRSSEEKIKIYEYVISIALLISLCYQYPKESGSKESGSKTVAWDKGMSREFALRARAAFYKAAKLTIQQSEDNDCAMKYRTVLDQLKDSEAKLIGYCNKIGGVELWKPICSFQEVSENIKQAETTFIPRQIPEYDPPPYLFRGSYSVL